LNLLRLLDLHLLVSKYELDWEQVCQGAVDLGWAYAVERGLRLAAGLYHTPVPDAAWEGLNSHLGKEPTRRIAARLQQRIARWEEWKTLFRYQTAAGRFHLVWATLFPPQAYVRELYALPAGRKVLPYYFFRWWDGGREVARSLVAGRSRPRDERPRPRPGGFPGEERESE
jgi:hypothetical protein